MTRLSSRLCAAGLAVALVLGTASAANAGSGRHSHHNNGSGGAAFAAALFGGLLIGGLIASQPAYAAPAYGAPAPAYGGSNPHTDWCYRNSAGYNPYDNTSQGYFQGQRVACRSPFGG